MTKATHRKIQLFLFALCVLVCGFYYHYYKRNRELDVYRIQLWAELQIHAITKQEYWRLWDPKIKEWKESLSKCELLELSSVLVFLLSAANLIVYWQYKKRVLRVKAG
ncbi:hypothetical protein [Pedobacter kyonggii]|uniref:Uncharacterized protein n=1 Tax=Pedobacter kyonggii TaxID=1926871 RepID=A0A4Q9HE97_9SPHI|nr:hypothetical protein [Pedobacter kyonggii]TBO43104.1 hypothetical protein EYS08_07040 [Pedobacter kyonggii]